MRVLVTTVLLVPLAACASPTAFDRGLADLRAGRYAEAKAAFDEALQASAAALANRGVARARLGDLDGAIDDYTRALDLAPGDGDILFDRGNAWAAKGEYHRAMADFRRAAETDPRRAQALFRNAAIELQREPNVTATPPVAAAPPAAAPSPPPAPERTAPAPAGTPPAPEAGPATPEPAPTSAPPPAPASEAAPENGVPSAPPATTAPSAPPPAPPAASEPSAPAVAMVPPAAPELDARALGSRALTRELQGDHAGALEDLRAAIVRETDPERLTGLRNLLLLLESQRDRRDQDVRGDSTR
ncbi:MAG: hypothetical protein AUG87_02965 [Candidatus Rokubacteria bacterium 13_1_20CM_4_70_14]|nr:MAG: hypothetical protein AUG87_02965 [Candidatus Rokubacteria bacterium 13_1_20CM_4_70_14]